MQRRPREKNDSHLKFIRSLPCLICDDGTTVEAAHVRYGDRSVKKPQTGIGTKPDDKYTVPLCGKHHREQHMEGERLWWSQWGIDPVKVALALYAESGDQERGEQIVQR